MFIVSYEDFYFLVKQENILLNETWLVIEIERENVGVSNVKTKSKEIETSKLDMYSGRTRVWRARLGGQFRDAFP